MQKLTVTLNKKLCEELYKAAVETRCCVGGGWVSAEQYAAEIIESYMASRRLKRADAFIDETMASAPFASITVR